MRTALVGLTALASLVWIADSHAQSTPPASPPAASPQTAAPTPAAPAAAAPASAPAAGAAPASAGATETVAAPAKPTREATGYAPSSIRSAIGGGGGSRKSGTKAAAAGTAKKKTPRAARPGSVIQPGFEAIEGGGSRVFVELAQTVPVEERKAKGTLTYVLKGAHNPLRNNFNPLVTEHFNTPVRRARLVPAGRDLHFVIELRQDVTASHHFVSNKEGHSVLQVDFGSGTFLKEPVQPIPTPEGDDEGAREGGDKAAPAQSAPSNKRPSSKGPQP